MSVSQCQHSDAKRAGPRRVECPNCHLNGTIRNNGEFDWSRQPFEMTKTSLEECEMIDAQLKDWITDLSDRCDCMVSVTVDVFPRIPGFKPRWSIWKGAKHFKADSLTELVDLAENACDGRSVLLAARAQMAAEKAAAADEADDRTDADRREEWRELTR